MDTPKIKKEEETPVSLEGISRLSCKRYVAGSFPALGEFYAKHKHSKQIIFVLRTASFLLPCPLSLFGESSAPIFATFDLGTQVGTSAHYL